MDFLRGIGFDAELPIFLKKEGTETTGFFHDGPGGGVMYQSLTETLDDTLDYSEAWEMVGRLYCSFEHTERLKTAMDEIRSYLK